MVDTYLANSNWSKAQQKRFNRVERLSREIGATVAYGLTFRGVHVDYQGSSYEASGLRDADGLLRHLKKLVRVK